MRKLHGYRAAVDQELENLAIRHNVALENAIPEEPFVFLGGTTNDTDWRYRIIKRLTVKYFNPTVDNWTEADIQEEERAKVAAKAVLYVITPKQLGVYSLVEMAVSACLNREKKVVIVFLREDDGDAFDEGQLKSIAAVKDLLTKHTNAEFFITLEDAAATINEYVSAFKE